MSSTNWNLFALVAGALSIVGLVIAALRRLYLKYDWPYILYKNRRILYKNRRRLRGFIFGFFLVLSGPVFLGFSSFWTDVLASFMLTTGAQVVLGAVGIRLELFGNNPEATT